MFGATTFATALRRLAGRCVWLGAVAIASSGAGLARPAHAQTAAASTPAAPLLLIDEPTGLAWRASEVARAGAGAATSVLGKAEGAEQARCRTHCAVIARVWRSLATVISAQQAQRAHPVELSLHVVQSDDINAFSVPDGTLVLSEAFVRSRQLDDAQLAFVLAHEASHVLLEHERQALTAALSLLPHNVPRSVDDIYVEFGFNIAVLRLLEPVMHQAEFEADELGLQLAALAGHAPGEQLRFMAHEADADAPLAAVVSTHPTAATRLARLQTRLPLAQRVFEYGVQQRASAAGGAVPEHD